MNKKTIAFLTRSIIDSTGNNMWKGLESECRRENIPLITFRGPVLNKGQGSILYYLINDSSYSGIISWASSDVDQGTIDFYKRYTKTPLVCMTFRVQGHPLIITDCRTGIMELMDHLIKVHNFTKIAFIRGPENHVYAKDRYEGYLESLSNHGIPLDEEIISPCGGWSISDGAKAIDDFIAKGLRPGKDFQCVVAVGDNVAIGAQEHLIKKGFSVPHDVAVCGFNGTNDAAWSNPPLTTVEMPFFGLGVKGFETLKNISHNVPVPEVIRYNTKLIMGESCGCTSTSVLKSNFVKQNTQSFESKKKAAKANLKILEKFNDAETVQTLTGTLWQETTAKQILDSISGNRYVTSEILDFFAAFMPKLISTFVEDLFSKSEKSSYFINTLSYGLNKFISLTKEFSVWQDIISILRIELLSAIYSNTMLSKTENLLQQARISINEVDCRTQKFKNLLDSRKEAAIRQASTSILSCSDISELMNIISKSISALNISSVYVALYNDCNFTLQNQQIPETSRMILAINNGDRFPLPQEGLTFNTTEIIPESIFSTETFASFVIESLHYQDQILGYIVFEGNQEDGVTYSTLRDLISCSLYSAILLQQRNKGQLILQETMQTMTEKADLVSAQSEGITGNITTISSSMNNVANNIKDISQNISIVAEILNSANRLITDANSEIENLVDDTEQITNSIRLINDIAEKTNVLALNAAIEAAHAGDAGRGFNVVAKEVKSLAAQTVSSTQTIQDLVERNNLNTKQMRELINSTTTAIKKIAQISDSIKISINDQVQSSEAISLQLKDAAAGASHISNAILEVSQLGDKLKN